VLPAAVRPVLARAGASAVRADFATSLARTLWFQVGVFGLAFLMMLAWPRGAGRKATGPHGAPASQGAAAGQDAARLTAVAGNGHRAAAATPSGSGLPGQAT